MDTGASVTCLGFDIWWRYCAQWGPLKQFKGTVHGTHGKPLQIARKTQHLYIQWGEAHGRTSFIIIVGLDSPPCLIGMDIMRPLRVHIDVINGTATLAQPNPQTAHLNAAQSQQQREKMPLPGTELPVMEAARPPQNQQQREKMPLSEVGSPAVGAASPPRFLQQRKESHCRKSAPRPWEVLIHLNLSRNEGKCRCLRPRFKPLPSQKPLPQSLQPPLCPASRPLVLHCRLPHRVPPPPTQLAVLGYCKPQTFLQRWLASFAATTRGRPRTSFFVLTTLCRHL